ncbi:MAG TPA: DUF3159 domain-containing protein [Solirubrobacterales bacterium]|nr:DUF3159 domain-containing protein [Solirubrobacterales bacterium]HMU27079.1 DUF3159 domain-containing protein [Solirubrobacterales bacterium]HMW44676.1 DUF3159 domain-containing protein [Solirubrobacterales bacterium]HMX70880.1 DUF3159 domain-containing protein [Solirubrobacterales bacterium]HMY26079.1 DUF3159 domain-containing protein [Solirubrobacterales bacterium]
MSEVHRTEDQVEVELDQKEEINLLDELGGPQGIADSSIPGLVFVIAYTVSGQKLELAAGVAVGIALLIALIRLVRGERARYAASGFFGVALAAFIATRTGKAEDFFLPGLLFNAGYSLAYAISIAIRWPLMGVFIGPLIGEGMTWREDPERVKLFNKISWLWVGTFLLRLAVQLPLYLSGALVALGIAKTAMGLPIFALAIYLSYLMLKAAGIDLQQKKEAEEAG